MSTLQTGTVKWFDDGKGFGFITPADGSKDLFAHHSEIKNNGGFRSVEQLDRVKGIGPAVMGKLRGLVTTGDDKGDQALAGQRQQRHLPCVSADAWRLQCTGDGSGLRCGNVRREIVRAPI